MATAVRNVLSKKQEALKKCSQSVIFRQPERLYDGYLQRLDQLQLRLKQSLANTDFLIATKLFTSKDAFNWSNYHLLPKSNAIKTA